MKVKRITANINASDVSKSNEFYKEIFGLDVVMDLGWIRTYAADNQMQVQISIVSESGSDTDIPDLSIEVDDLDEILLRIQQANIDIEYGPTIEPWGVKRFFIRDPFGKLLNVLQHD